jgi:hypothetical protein
VNTVNRICRERTSNDAVPVGHRILRGLVMSLWSQPSTQGPRHVPR